VSELKMRTTMVCFHVTQYCEVRIEVPEELTDAQAAAAIERQYNPPSWVNDAREYMYSCSEGNIDWDRGIEVIT